MELIAQALESFFIGSNLGSIFSFLCATFGKLHTLTFASFSSKGDQDAFLYKKGLRRSIWEETGG